MRLSLNWLRDCVDIEMSPKELSLLLTMSGLEVESLEPIGQSLEEIIAARIIALTSHRGAERLSICRMDTGKGIVQVVCGAPNLETGLIVPMALPGTTLPNGVLVEEGRFRGELSVGMLLAEDEMGLTGDHTGIMILPSNLRPGDKVAEALSLQDWALEINVTPNRPDCASVIGVAREIAAITGKGLRRPEISFKEEEGAPIEGLARVSIEDPKGCPRYAAGMIRGVSMGPSPFWMRYRLHVSGVRGINNIVDVSNYVLLEMGQPLHAFDYDRLIEGRIVVRRAAQGEFFTTLDGKTHALDEEHLMICDGQRAVALAGIMGGLNSEIFEGSRNVLIESACFDPVTIRRGSKKLGLSTEASYRFERGVDIEGVIPALRRSLMLMSQLAGGEVPRGTIDQYPLPHEPRLIDLRIDRTNAFLGASLSRVQVSGYLRALEMEMKEVGGNVLRVRPPSFRVDLTREVDLMEEVARLEGYDQVPVTSPFIRPSDRREAPELAVSEKAREVMVGLGFSEIISYSFISPEWPDILGAGNGSSLRSFVTLMNPLSNEQSVMRTSLLPGLLSAVKTNVTHGESDLKLFEWGKIFLRDEKAELPQEILSLSAVMTGLFNRKEWYCEERAVDFYDIKGSVEALLRAFGASAVSFQRGECPPGYHPDVVSTIHVSGTKVGSLGQVSPDVLTRYDLEIGSAFIFELDMRLLMEKLSISRRFKSLTRFPAVLRDLCVIVDGGVECGRVQEVISREGGGMVESVSLFDHYEGGKLGPFEKSLAFRVCYRSREGTLDGKTVNQLHQRIIERIGQETGGRLRES